MQVHSTRRAPTALGTSALTGSSQATTISPRAVCLITATIHAAGGLPRHVDRGSEHLPASRSTQHAARRRCVACMVKCIPVCTAENSDRVCELLASRGVAQPRARPSSTAPTQVSKRNVTARPRRPSAPSHRATAPCPCRSPVPPRSARSPATTTPSTAAAGSARAP